MEITEPRRLYQQLAADLKERIEQGVYLVGDKLPAERFIADEKNVSRTVVREAIIMLLSWQCGSTWKTPRSCYLTKPATISSSMPTAICSPKTRWCISIQPPAAVNEIPVRQALQCACLSRR